MLSRNCCRSGRPRSELRNRRAKRVPGQLVDNDGYFKKERAQALPKETIGRQVAGMPVQVVPIQDGLSVKKVQRIEMPTF